MTNITELKEKLREQFNDYDFLCGDKPAPVVAALLSIIEDMQKCIEFYSDLYVFDVDMADDDCEQDPIKTWRYVSGKNARQTLTATEQKLKKLTEEK